MLVALSMVVLLGAIAMSIDVGRLYQERRELQNGADAAAHAVAYDCATGDCGASRATADQYADSNASDGLASVDAVIVDEAARKVTVRTKTEVAGGGNRFPMTFARLVGFDGVTVTAEATAQWGGPLGGTTLPILMRVDLWNDVRGSRLVSLADATNGTAPPGSLLTIAHLAESSPADPASARFVWLEGSHGCALDVEIGELVEATGGSEPPPDCNGSTRSSIIGNVSLVSFFDESGVSNIREVAGLAALYVTDMDDCGVDGYCIQGYLVRDYIVDGPLGDDTFGVYAIQFVSG